MPRIRVDLKKLPPWQQYLIAVVVAAGVIAAAWAFGGDRPVPPWVYDYVVPVAGGFGIFAIAYLLLFGRGK